MTCLTNRMGDKGRLLPLLAEQFPRFNCFIDLFFGGGSVTYFVLSNYKNAKIIANDLDSEISNLFFQMQSNGEALIEAIETTPYHEDVFRFWIKDKSEVSDFERAVRYWYLANYSYMGKADTLLYETRFNLDARRRKLHDFFKVINQIMFMNFDYKKALENISFKNPDTCFIYADPPYLNTTSYTNEWVEKDAKELIKSLIKTGCKFMVSEFDNEFYKELALKYNLNYIKLKTRRDGLNQRTEKTEIIVTNYNINLKLF